MFLKLSKSVSFLHFFADVSNKSEAVIVVYVYAFESSRFTLLRERYWLLWLLCYVL